MLTSHPLLLDLLFLNSFVCIRTKLHCVWQQLSAELCILCSELSSKPPRICPPPLTLLVKLSQNSLLCMTVVSGFGSEVVMNQFLCGPQLSQVCDLLIKYSCKNSAKVASASRQALIVHICACALVRTSDNQSLLFNSGLLLTVVCIGSSCQMPELFYAAFLLCCFF